MRRLPVWQDLVWQDLERRGARESEDVFFRGLESVCGD
jgi:hypothetical protein